MKYSFSSSSKSFWLSSIICFYAFASVYKTVSCKKKEYYFEPSEMSLNRAFFNNYLAFITVACIWITLLIAFVIFRIYYIDERNKLRQVFDDCSPSTSQFKYLIRVRIGTCSPNFQKDTSAIMMDLLDSKNRFITRLSISPSWLKVDVYPKQSTEKLRLRKLKFVLNRAVPMPNIGAIRISHDSYFPVGGYIFIHSIDIRNFRENTVITVAVFKRIFVLPPDANEFDQVFRAKPPTSPTNDSDFSIGGYSPFISFPEYLVFFFFYANICLLTTMFKPTYMLITEIYQAALNGLFGFAVALAITFFIIVFYRYCVKVFYSRYRAMGPWAIVRVIFLTSVFLIAAIVGFTSSLIQSRYSSKALSYWSLAALIADVLLVATLVPLAAIKILLNVRDNRKNGKFAVQSIAANMVDENKPPEEKSRIGDATTSRSKGIQRKDAKLGKQVTSTVRQLDEAYDTNAMDTIIRQKASIEEGLDLSEGQKESVRHRILHRIHSVLRGSSKIDKSIEDDKAYAINRELEDKSNTDRANSNK